MRQVAYTDSDGRKWAVRLPDGIPDADAAMGLCVGPPSLASLKLPLDVEVRLHNQLYERNLIVRENIRGRNQSILAAIQSALKVDVGKVAGLYNTEGAEQLPSVAMPSVEEDLLANASGDEGDSDS